MITIEQFTEALRALQNYREHILGLGIVPPDLKPILDLLASKDKEIEKFEKQKTLLQVEIAEAHRVIATMEPNKQKALTVKQELDQLTAAKAEAEEFLKSVRERFTVS
jgi:predicted  nucleic acid-binding Zn-ribbon protein